MIPGVLNIFYYNIMFITVMCRESNIQEENVKYQKEFFFFLFLFLRKALNQMFIWIWVTNVEGLTSMVSGSLLGPNGIPLHLWAITLSVT